MVHNSSFKVQVVFSTFVCNLPSFNKTPFAIFLYAIIRSINKEFIEIEFRFAGMVVETEQDSTMVHPLLDVLQPVTSLC